MFTALDGRITRSLFFAAALSVAPLASAEYVFTNIVDNSGRFAEIMTPALNDKAEIAFFATLDTRSSGIFIVRDGKISRLARGNVGPYPPSINGNGRVAFHDPRSGRNAAIVTGRGGPLTTVALSTGPTFGFIYEPKINDLGQLSFHAHLDDFRGKGIFIVNPDGSIETVAMRKSSVSPYGGFADLNNKGAVAFRARLNDQGKAAIVKYANGRLRPLVVSEELVHDFGVPVLNDAGQVAFTTGQANDSGMRNQGVHIADNDSVSQIAGLPFTAFLTVSLNNAGNVAFTARVAESFGVFTGADPEGDKVLRTGDMLFGSVVETLAIGTEALNNRGQIAFRYSLEDGRNGVAIATPDP